MAVRKTGRYYQIDYYVGGKRVRETLKGVTTKQEALEIERERLRNGIGPIQFKRFKDLAEWYLTHPDKAQKKTLDKDRERLDLHLLPYFGHCKSQDITPSMVDDYKVKRLKDFAAPATINRELALLRHILRFAYRKEKIHRVPPISLLKEDNVRQRFITEEEIQKILEYLSGDARDVVIVAYHTGMRLGEILDLRWKNVDLKRRLFVFKGEKSNGRERAVALAPEVVEVLSRRPRGLPGVKLFHLKMYQVEGAWGRACKKVGVKDAKIHDLRRTRCTIWHKEEGLPQDLIMSMSGHRTDSMFRRYQITSTEFVESLARKWAEQKGGNRNGETNS
ncbi:MAG: site-specific integrase [Deltaproteobacteria bacterium]|nr:site-specific integrase [Deltaproteobacteria bacterium]